MDGRPPLPDLREADLTGPVRRALGSESVIPADWQVHPLAGGRGEITGGVYRIVGGGHDQGLRVSWSLVLKVVPEPDEDDGPAAHNYWKREFRCYQAGLLADLPGISAPRCWGACDRPGEGTWLWLEDITGPRQDNWRDQHYARAARSLGQFGAAYLKERPLPRGAWLSDRMLRKESAFFGPYLRDLPAALDHPLVRQACPAEQAARLERLWAVREALLKQVEALPRTFCHLDAIRRNLHRREGTVGTRTVAFDWEWAGIGALGEDLAPLVAGSLCMGRRRGQRPAPGCRGVHRVHRRPARRGVAGRPGRGALCLLRRPPRCATGCGARGWPASSPGRRMATRPSRPSSRAPLGPS